MTDRLSITKKLVLMLIVPIAGLFVFSALQTSERLAVVSSMEELDRLTNLAIATSQLTHELQKERGRTAGTLGRTSGESSDLSVQYGQTDEAAAAFRQVLDSVVVEGELARAVERAQQRLNSLGNHRSAVSVGNLSIAEGTGYYTDTVAALIAIISAIAEEASTPSIAFRLVSLDSVVRLKELAGQERALLNARLAAHEISADVVRPLAENLGMQEAYEEMFLAHASDEVTRLFREKMSASHVEEVGRLRALAMTAVERPGEEVPRSVVPDGEEPADARVPSALRVSASAEDWWRVSTARIDGMFDVEGLIQRQTQEEVAQLRSDASWALAFFALLALLSIVGAMALSYLLARGIIRSFTSASETLQRVVSQIAGFVQQQSSSTSQTASSVSETTTTVEEIRKTAETADSSAKEMSGVAQQSRTASAEAIEAVAHGTEAMRLIRSEVETIAQNILELSEKNIQIGEIVQTVNAIAEQSNLLAVNASIEAAKAGDHGRGFSVVANEVKALAQQSKEATDQIRSILSEIQKSSNAAVMITEQGVKRVEEGAALIEELGRTIQNLSGAVEQNADSASQISLISTQQLTGIEQITEAMRNIGAATTQNVEGARQLEDAAGEIRAVSTRILEVVHGHRTAA